MHPVTKKMLRGNIWEVSTWYLEYVGEWQLVDTRCSLLLTPNDVNVRSATPFWHYINH